MKRFHWPLQRLLDVTLQRESAARAALEALTQAIAAKRETIAAGQAQMKALLENLAAEPFERRVAQQDTVMKAADRLDKQVRALQAQLATLLAERKDRMAALLALRSRRQTLEKLRDEAHAKWRHQQDLLEQKQLDEAASVAFARKMTSVSDDNR